MISQMMLSSSVVLSLPFRVLISPYQECIRFDNYSMTMMMRPTLNPGEFHQKDLMWFSRVMEENLNPEVLELLNWFGACCLRLKVNLGCYIFVGRLSLTATIAKAHKFTISITYSYSELFNVIQQNYSFQENSMVYTLFFKCTIYI